MGFLSDLWQDIQAARRGERRVQPRGTRGRVYARKDGKDKSAGSHGVRNEPTVDVGIKVYRADGSVEVVGSVPGHISENPEQ